VFAPVSYIVFSPNACRGYTEIIARVTPATRDRILCLDDQIRIGAMQITFEALTKPTRIMPRSSYASYGNKSRFAPFQSQTIYTRLPQQQLPLHTLRPRRPARGHWLAKQKPGLYGVQDVLGL
jgi:hypothetical protein